MNSGYDAAMSHLQRIMEQKNEYARQADQE
jgi:hypothetical protein